jgi:hypothetical protein
MNSPIEPPWRTQSALVVRPKVRRIAGGAATNGCGCRRNFPQKCRSEILQLIVSPVSRARAQAWGTRDESRPSSTGGCRSRRLPGSWASIATGSRSYRPRPGASGVRTDRRRANHPRDKRRMALRECRTRLSLRTSSHATRGDVAKNLSMTADEYDAVPSGISFVPFDFVIGH